MNALDLKERSAAEEQPQTRKSALREVNDSVDSRWRELLGRVQLERTTKRMIVILVAAFALFSALAPSVFLSGVNLRNIGIGAPEIGIIAIAMMLAMLTGGIDLSLVGIANMSAITVVTVYAAVAETNQSLAESMTIVLVLIGLGVGVLLGAVNGWLVSVVGITPILATLGTMQVYNGLAVAWTGGSVLHGVPDAMTNLGQGTLLGIPWLFLVFLGVAGAVGLILNRSRLGYKARLQGANRTAAEFSGIRGRNVLMHTYLLSGLLGGVAGLTFISRNPTASADYGSTYVLLVIVICVLGGTNPKGGFATVLGVVLATLTLQVVFSGFNALRLSAFEYQIAQGVILIAVMVFDQIRWRRRKTVTG